VTPTITPTNTQTPTITPTNTQTPTPTLPQCDTCQTATATQYESTLKWIDCYGLLRQLSVEDGYVFSCICSQGGVEWITGSGTITNCPSIYPCAPFVGEDYWTCAP
jgi:hypothetical protein